MRTIGAGFLLVATIACVLVDGLIAGLFVYNAFTPASPNPAVLPTDRSWLMVPALFFAGLSASGVFGVVKLIRARSKSWLLPVIATSVVALLVLFSLSMQGLNY